MALDIRTHTTINAPINKVWNKLTNFENYPQWNLFIRKIEGEQAIGKTLHVEILPKGDKKVTIFQPTLTKFVLNSEIRWVGTLGAQWLFRGEHYFQLKDNCDGTTDLTHGEHFTGWLVPILGCFIQKKTTAGFILMNENLKAIVERE
jgi:hypothetical protein